MVENFTLTPRTKNVKFNKSLIRVKNIEEPYWFLFISALVTQEEKKEKAN